MFTRREELTWRGDCIIGVRASKGAADLSDEFKALAREDCSIIEMRMDASAVHERVWGRGSGKLSFTHPDDIVVRRSRFTCGRTLMFSSDKAAADLSRHLVRLMRNPDQRMVVTMTAYSDRRGL